MNDIQDGCQNSRHLWSVCTWGHSNLVIYHPVSSNFIYGLLSSNSFPRLTVEIFRWIVTKMATKMAAPCQFAHVDTLTWSFITQFLPNFIYGLLSWNYCSCLNIGFVLWTIIKMVAKKDIPCSLQDIMRGPLSESGCSSNGPRHEKTCLRGLLTTKAQAMLRIHAVWPTSLLFTYWNVSYLNLLLMKLQFSS